MKSSPTKPRATAVLAVYNSEKTISAAIASLQNQSVPVEIIVVDDGSTDQTLSILKALPVRLYHQSHQGPAIARNLGARYASTNILLFVDADMTFAHDYVQVLIEPIIAGQCIGTYTGNERVSNWDNIWARCLNIQEGWAEQMRFPPNPPHYGTDFRAIDKAQFDQVGGFDNLGYTDTWSLYKKLGIRPLLTHAKCYHQNPNNLFSVYHQARWSAKRPYKYGSFGILYALLRTSPLTSILLGFYYAIAFQNPAFIVYKIVYDWGRLVGIIDMLTTGNLQKL